ncbi:GNAT family N-acetyltransferase [Chitinibacteraceae bacterium HSL-7]
MPVTVKPVSPDLYESLTSLLYELHCFYTNPATASREDIRSHLLENLLPQAGFCLPVAVDEGNHVLGFAALVLMHSLVDPGADGRKQCLLKELYVSSSSRSRGIGKQLIQWAAAYSLRSGCGRMDWNVKASNDRGIDFYKSLGGQQVEDRLSFRLSAESLSQLAHGVA